MHTCKIRGQLLILLINTYFYLVRLVGDGQNFPWGLSLVYFWCCQWCAYTHHFIGVLINFADVKFVYFSYMIINIVFMNQQELTGLNSSNVEDGGEDDDDDDGDEDDDDDDDDEEEELGLSALQGGDIEVYAYTIVYCK